MINELARQSGLIEEAKAEGERSMIQLVLEGRFGVLSADLLAALGAADEATLKLIGQHAATDSLEQVRARLGLP